MDSTQPKWDGTWPPPQGASAVCRLPHSLTSAGHTGSDRYRLFQGEIVEIINATEYRSSSTAAVTLTRVVTAAHPLHGLISLGINCFEPVKQIRNAASRWNGRGEPPVGTRVELSAAPDSPRGTVKLPADSDGNVVILDDNGCYWVNHPCDLYPEETEEQKTISKIASILRNTSHVPATQRAAEIYNALND